MGMKHIFGEKIQHKGHLKLGLFPTTGQLYILLTAFNHSNKNCAALRVQ